MWRAAALAVVFFVPALADDTARTLCFGDPQATAQQRVVACSKLIEAPAPGPEAYINRATAYEQLGDAAAASADYGRAVALGSIEALVFRAELHLDRGETDAAITDFDAAIAAQPAKARSWNGRGQAYRRKGDLDRAIADFSKAIALDPEYITALANRGSVHLDRRDHDAAIADFTRALQVFGDPDPPILNDRGLAFTHKRDFARALDDFNRAIAADPKMAKAFSNRGIVYGMTGKYDLAIADFSHAIELAPEWPEGHANRGRTYLSMHRHEEAIADYGKAIALNPSKAEFYLQRCMTYTAKGDAAKALADCDHAIALKSDDGEFFYRRALARFRNADVLNARADLDEAVKRTPDHVASLMLRSRLYLSSRKMRRELAQSDQSEEMKKAFESLLDAVAPVRESPVEEARAAADIASAIRSDPTVFNRDNPCDSDVNGAATLKDSVASCRKTLPDGFDERLVLEFTACALLNGKHFDRAVEAFDFLLSSQPRDAMALWGRGVARKAKGESRAAADDMASARRINPDLAAVLALPGE